MATQPRHLHRLLALLDPLLGRPPLVVEPHRAVSGTWIANIEKSRRHAIHAVLLRKALRLIAPWGFVALLAVLAGLAGTARLIKAVRPQERRRRSRDHPVCLPVDRQAGRDRS